MSRKSNVKKSARSSSRKVRIMKWSRPTACFRIVVAMPRTSRATVAPDRFKTAKAAEAFVKKQRLVLA